MIKTLSKCLAVLFLVTALSFAQTTVSSTTLSAAITSLTQTTVRVASATGITGFSNGQPTTFIYVDRELMPVFSVSGTTLVVQRSGLSGGTVSTHANSAVVWLGPYSAFLQADPGNGTPCTAANLNYLPAISVPTGTLWNCGNSLWGNFGAYNIRMTVGAQLVAAATIAPTNLVHHITGATAVSTITVPPSLPATGGCFTLIPDAAGSTTSTGGNIALATTTAASKQLILCYDPGTSKWYPSY